MKLLRFAFKSVFWTAWVVSFLTVAYLRHRWLKRKQAS